MVAEVIGDGVARFVGRERAVGLDLELCRGIDARQCRLYRYASTKTGHPAYDMLRYGNHNALCYDITCGRISPWVIYNSEAGQKFLTEISSEQLAMIWSYIDSDFWQKKFHDYMADQEFVNDILAKAGW